ncbi:MAG: T9SS type A sorting domain-containing protein, partial [Candidatus Marinimicrobia bacterium]|nr:T9SS type A sorting domain-containing protein [Candidatus Neomarinimicrobiota bacterium]
LGTEQLVSDSFGDQKNLQLSFADDHSGVLYAAWQDFNGFHYDIFAKNLTTDTAAEQITTLLSDDKNPALATVNASRYLLAWEDWSDEISTDLYFYDSEPGSPGNVSGGIPLSLAVLSQKEPRIVAFADNAPDSMNYLITWLDMRSSGKTELTNIYAQAYTSLIVSIDEPVLAEAFELAAAFPNPFNGSVTLPIKNGSGSNLDLWVYDLQGREILHEQLSSDPGLNYVWNGLDRNGNTLSSGIYLISVASGNQRFSQKIMLLK